MLVTFCVGFLLALFTGVFGFGLSWGAAIIAALGVATNAIGIHSATQAIGAGVHATTVTSTSLTALGDGEAYAVTISTNSAGNSDWTLRAVKAVVESTKVQYDRLA